jgi:large conductance mechanosensitive channel
MWKELREFLARGNVMDLAIGLVIGASFTGIVTALTEGVLMALIAAIFGQPTFDDLQIDLRGTPIEYGRVLTAVLNFLIVGTTLFFVIKAVNRLRGIKPPPKTEPAKPVETDHDVLVQIRDELRSQRASARATPAE